MADNSLFYLKETYKNNCLAGDGIFTEKCHEWLKSKMAVSSALITHSCTAALEMAALILDISPGDEVIMPSYTFVSTANAFVLRGAIPVFVDINADTLNLDENLVEEAITSKTRAIVPVHYAGVSCEMDRIMSIAREHKLHVIEDAAQGVMSSYHGRALGSIGDIGTFSFHETKNITCGEGGAILLKNKTFSRKAEIIREKGTDRSKFFRGEVKKYTWQSLGSSYLPGEMTAAFLLGQLELADQYTSSRLSAWHYYYKNLKDLADKELIKLPYVPEGCKHNGHMFYILEKDLQHRNLLIDFLKKNDIGAVTHYEPLHLSKAGMLYGRCSGKLDQTVSNSNRIIRLPLWNKITPNQQDKVIETLYNALTN